MYTKKCRTSKMQDRHSHMGRRSFNWRNSRCCHWNLAWIQNLMIPIQKIFFHDDAIIYSFVSLSESGWYAFQSPPPKSVLPIQAARRLARCRSKIRVFQKRCLQAASEVPYTPCVRTAKLFGKMYWDRSRYHFQRVKTAFLPAWLKS